MANFDKNWTPADLDEVHAILGFPEATFRVDRRIIVIEALVFCAGLVAIFTALSSTGLVPEFPNLIWLMLSMGALLALARICWVRRNLNMEIQIYPQGIIVLGQGRVDPIAWEQIVSCKFRQGNVVTLVWRTQSGIENRSGCIENPLQFVALATEKARQTHGSFLMAGRSLKALDLSGLSAFAQRVVESSDGIAREQKCDYVGTEHLLLSLLGFSSSDAVAMLQRIGASPTAIRSALVDLPANAVPDYARGKTLPVTPMLARTLLAARAEPNSGGDGTLALLLALLSESTGIAGHTLAQAGLTCEAVRQSLRAVRPDSL